MNTQIVRKMRGHSQATCSCGWQGVHHPTRTAEGATLASRDAIEHGNAHERGTGWFDYTRGWVTP